MPLREDGFQSMRITDVMIDLNDIWGRVVPGFLLALDLYLTANLIDPIDHQALFTIFVQRSFGSTFLVLTLLVILAQILGELSLYPIFKLKRFFVNVTLREQLDDLDVTTGRQITSFYQKRFDENALNSTSGPVFSFCKEYLLLACPEAYAQALRIEARINLKGGMVIPLIYLSVISVLSQLWMVVVVSSLLAVTFANGFRTSFDGEHQFVFRAYYNCVPLKGKPDAA